MRCSERRLAETMDRLSCEARTQDPERFIDLLDGSVGVGGLYDAGRRLKAWSRGRRFDGAHVQAARVDER